MATTRQLRVEERDIAQRAADALRAGLGDSLVAVVLFGSHARGRATAESDWDLLVIARGLPERVFPRHLSLKQMLPVEFRGAVSLLAKTPEEFESRLPTLYLDIALDGVIVYDPTGYAARRLEEIRRQMDRLGLYRRHTKAGDVWRWRRQPRAEWALEWSIQS